MYTSFLNIKSAVVKEKMKKIFQLGLGVLLVLAGFLGIINLTSENAQGTNVSGTISMDTTWDIAGSPYIVVGDVIVQNGVTLTIDPDVQVKFDGYYSLYVDGSLIAAGSQTNGIVITSNMAVPGPKDWNRIQINSTAQAIIKYCNISYATYGIYLESSTYNEITNNDIFTNGQFPGGAGVYLESSSNNEITNNDFSKNWNVIYLESSPNNNITSNNVSSTFEKGIILESSSYNNITANNITNTGGGIRLTSSSYNNITGNNFSNNGGCICLSSSSNNTIIDNKLSANNWGGIELQSLSNDNIITDNNVINNVEGIYLSYSRNNVIAGNDLTDNSNGIHLDFSSSYNTITGNNLSDNELGLYLRASYYIDVTNNNFLNDGINLWGDEVSHYTTHTIPSSNLVNGKPLYYYKDCNGIDIDGVSVGQLVLANCENVIVKNLQINNTYAGIEVFMSRNILVTKSHLFSNYRGIYLRSSTDNVITQNNITDNSYGLELWSSSNSNAISNNIVSSNGRAIWLFSSSNNNIITGNNISNNSYGISILSSSVNNEIYHNNIVNNTLGQALDNTDSNTWNEAYPSGGNYWSDWTSPDLMSGPDQDIPGSDGIVDNPYIIDPDSQDKYPLVDPGWFPDTIPPTITNLQPSNASTTNNNTPMISADYSDLSGINVSSILLKIDGTDVTSSAMVTISGVAYAPETAMEDGLHIVHLEVRDASVNSNLATAIWNFTVETESPIAYADRDKNIRIGDTIDFDGSASTDNIDNINQLNFTWNIIKDGNPIITLYGVNASYKFDEEGQYEVNLTVRDTAGNEGYHTINVTVSPPSAASSNFLTDYWWVLVVAGVAIIAGLLLFFKREKITKKEGKGKIAEIEEVEGESEKIEEKDSNVTSEDELQKTE